MEGLTSGRIAHFVSETGEHLAAVMAKVVNQETGCVDLMVFDSSNLAEAMGKVATPHRNVLYSENKEPGTWHWIERA